MREPECNQAGGPEALTRSRAALARRIARRVPRQGRLDTAISALSLTRWEAPTALTSVMHEPSLCLVVQGAKRVLLGRESYTYDAYHFLITAVDLPVVAQIVEASRERPYLGLVLRLRRQDITRMLVDSAVPLPPVRSGGRGMAVSEVTFPLLDAFDRLLDLLDAPEDIPMLAPLVEREILYRLLVSEQGTRLRQIGAAGTQGHRVAQAIDWLKEHFDKPLRIEALAGVARMSPSTLHRHFRDVTSMSPLQFQKSLRLHEARRVMLTEHLDAASAAFRVGYESHSQFNREYSRLFGAPPLRDIKSLRQRAAD